MSKKLRVTVLIGGPSAEHEVSLNTGKMIAKALNRKKYNVKTVTISKRGEWPIELPELKKDTHVVFNAMHGEYGEDGTIQKILDRAKISYTGSGARASKIGIDKIACHKLFAKARLNSPAFTVSRNLSAIAKLGLPLVVKPINRGSSVGTTIVYEWKQLARAIHNAEKYSPCVMFQRFIAGRELTCGVIEKNGKLIALPLTEIIPKKSNFFDYTAKYTKGASQEITPARVSSKITSAVQRAAITAHRVVGCCGYSRSDFVLGNDGRLYILEINTLPGMTATSLLPQGAAAKGISFPRLLDIIIEHALVCP